MTGSFILKHVIIFFKNHHNCYCQILTVLLKPSSNDLHDYTEEGHNRIRGGEIFVHNSVDNARITQEKTLSQMLIDVLKW